jgi:hypothetical protein
MLGASTGCKARRRRSAKARNRGKRIARRCGVPWGTSLADIVTTVEIAGEVGWADPWGGRSSFFNRWHGTHQEGVRGASIFTIGQPQYEPVNVLALIWQMAT